MIYLQELLQRPVAWGHVQGDQARKMLQAYDGAILNISLEGIEHLDVSFARSAFIEFARSVRTHRGLCFTSGSTDIVENLDAAALKYEQPLVLWLPSGKYHILGPQPSIGLREMLDYVFTTPLARTSEAAAALHLKVANASNKLKALWQEGYVLRREQSADSGGIEYVYVRIA